MSIERVRTGVQKPPRTLVLDTIPLLPVATFQTRVEKIMLMMTFEEGLRVEFEPTALQRQSRDWGSRCCGIDVGAVLEPIGRALQGRRERKIREQIARELEALRTAAGRR